MSLSTNEPAGPTKDDRQAIAISNASTRQVIDAGGPSEPDDQDIRAAQKYFAKSQSENTRRAYSKHWAEFVEYCQWRKRVPLPAEAKAVVGYLTYVADAGAAPSTLRQKLAAISYVHKIKKHPLPSHFVEVTTLMEGITRAKAHKPRERKPLLLDGLHKLVNAIHAPYPVNLRDRAIMLVAYFGLLRRSELVSLMIEQVAFEPRDAGMAIRLSKSKTDQQEEGATLPYPRLDEADANVCPVRALREWLAALRDEYAATKGPIFRRIDQWGHIGEGALSGQVVNMLVKRYALKAGIVAAGDKTFDISAHSALRAGMATQLDKEQQPFSIIKKAGRWKSDSVARGYIRRDEDELRDALKRAASK